MVDAVRGSNPIWLFDDLQGNIMDDTFWFYVLEDTIPYNEAEVWQDSGRNVIWNQPIEVLANGTLPENIFYDPSVTYRLEWRKNNGILPPTQADQLIYLVEHYHPLGSSGDTPVGVQINAENQVTNPQFSIVYFTDGDTLSASGTYSVAPGWDLVLDGSGTVVLSQTTMTTDDEVPTNASYALDVDATSWSGTVYLRQRFNKNGILWNSTQINAQATIRLVSGAFNSLTSSLYLSTGAAVQTLFTGTLIAGTFTTYSFNDTLNTWTNTDVPPDAWVELRIAFPNSKIDITSVQMSPGFAQDYEQASIERQVDHMFNVYKPQLEYKPIPSYLVGWDFPLNPAQFATAASRAVAATAIGTNKSKYVWDQTIIFQSADSGVGVTGGSSGELVLTAAATTQMAIVQYLPPEQARKLLNGRFSVNIAAKASVATIATVSMWYTLDASLPDVSAGTNDSIVLTLDANGKPATKNGTWVEVARSGRGDAQFTIGTNATVEFNDYSFGGWDLEGDSDADAATFFAIVIGTASVANPETVSFYSVGLCGGDIATRPAPLSYDQTLGQCQYYYETTYTQGVVLGSSNVAGSLAVEQLIDPSPWDPTNDTHDLISRVIEVRFNTIKRTAGYIFQSYALDGTAGALTPFIFNAGASQALSPATISLGDYTKSNIGTKGITLVPANVNALTSSTAAFVGNFAEAFAKFHFSCDARLGIVA